MKWLKILNGEYSLTVGELEDHSTLAIELYEGKPHVYFMDDIEDKYPEVHPSKAFQKKLGRDWVDFIFKLNLENVK